MEQLKRVAAIHDLSGLGKCSLSVALPIISCAGVECACIPTAVLSTHTGEFTGYTFKDLTDQMLPIAEHWKTLDIKFDAIYTGYLGSVAQTEIVKNIIGLLKTDRTFVLVDPVMADNGIYYSNLGDTHCQGFRDLIKTADIITPNMTEAAFLLNKEYRQPPYDEAWLRSMLEELCLLGCRSAVITGAAVTEGKTGAACFDSVSGNYYLYETDIISGFYHGGGDIFASVLTACLCRGIPLNRSVKAAVDFVHMCIERTKLRATPTRFGMDFESVLHSLPQMINTLLQNN